MIYEIAHQVGIEASPKEIYRYLTETEKSSLPKRSKP
jgi:hypothetical protein